MRRSGQPVPYPEVAADWIAARLSGERLAAMITAFRIGPVLSDTILSALMQKHVHLSTLLLVVDGCPEPETTNAIAQRFLAAYPDQFRVLWLDNGGVSRARNEGLRYLLSADPDLTAIYCLDGDDLIASTSFATSLMALREAEAAEPDKKFGWVTSNKLNFGFDHNYIETPETFRPTSYLAVNLSQPTCLYNAKMFKDGVRWDQTMRTGAEDWEFWLEAIDRGYEGIFNPCDLLYYRQLMGSRSSVNRRNDTYNIPYMRNKHKALHSPRAVLQDEQATMPRYAFGLPWRGEFDCTTDPQSTGLQLTMEDVRHSLGGRLQRNDERAYIYDPYSPDIFCLMWPQLRRALDHARVLRGILMAAETMFASGISVVEVVIDELTGQQRSVAGPDGCFMFFQPTAPPLAQGADSERGALLVKLGQLMRRLGHRKFDIENVPGRVGRILVRSDQLNQAGAPGISYGRFAEFVETLATSDAGRHESRIGEGQRRGNRFHVSAKQSAQHGQLSNRAIGTLSLFPHIPNDGVAHMALILPADGLSAGPLRLMRALVERLGDGVEFSLFSVGPRVPVPPRTIAGHVKNVSTLHLWMNRISLHVQDHNVGVPRWDTMSPELQRRFAGIFAPFSRVFTFDLQVLSPVLLALKRYGVPGVCLHGSAPPPPMQPGMAPIQRQLAQLPDDPVAALNFAAAYRRIICEDPERADLLGSLGFPVSRIDRTIEDYLDAEHPAPAPVASAVSVGA